MVVGLEYGDSLKGERIVVLFNETKHPMNKSIVKKGSSSHRIMCNTFIENVICTLEYPIKRRVHEL